MNKKLQAGSTLALVITAIVIAIIGFGGYYAYQQISIQTKADSDSTMYEDEIMEDDSTIDEEMDEMMEDDNTMMDIKFSGTILAGNEAPLIDFNQADYDKAVSSDKLVVLYFYASWCPICQAEFPKMEEAFNQLSDENVVGFRVNYNDSQTDSNEEGLAREFGVAYQHTKVLLKNGERVLKAPETWDSADVYVSKINEYK